MLEIHPQDAEQRGIKDGDWVKLASREGDTALRALITDRVAPGVVYTTFHRPETQTNVVTTEFSDWATNCPEYKVTAVQVSPSNGPSEWQQDYDALARRNRRIAEPVAGRMKLEAVRFRSKASPGTANVRGAMRRAACPPKCRSPSSMTAAPKP